MRGEVRDFKLHALFIAFFGFVAYVTGIVAIQRWKNINYGWAVHPAEVLLGSMVLVGGILFSKLHYSLQYLGFYILGMVSVGMAVGTVFLLSKHQGRGGTREYGEEVGDTGNLSLWKKWLNFSRAVVDYEFRLLLLACYLAAIGPFAILFRSRRKRSANRQLVSSWLPRDSENPFEAARRPF